MDVKEAENNLTGFLFGNSLKALETLENVIRILLIVCWVIAVFPFGTVSMKRRMSSFFATSFLSLLIIHIYRAYGRPRWNRDVFSLLHLHPSTGCPSFVILLLRMPYRCSSSDLLYLPASR